MRILSDCGGKKRAGEIEFKRVIIESLGLTNSKLISQTFFMDSAIVDQSLLEVIITLVDTKHAYN